MLISELTLVNFGRGEKGVSVKVLSLPKAAALWGVSRARVWKLVSKEQGLPEWAVLPVDGRYYVDMEFAEAVGRKMAEVPAGSRRLLQAIAEVAAELEVR
jgi:hypothetical protein